MGAFLSSVLIVYTGTSVMSTFITCAAMFGGMSIYGTVTKRDLTGMGTFMMMGLFGLIIAMIVNLFLQSSAMAFVISAIGVIIFTGLTAYDTQKIRAFGENAPLDDATAIRRGALLGALTLFLLDELVRRRGGGEVHSDFLLLSAITLHNIPEGMAVGLAFALAADGESLAGAFALALGIGVQNFPEGAAVALPVYQSGKSKRRAFWTGVLSGAVEPLFGALVVLAAAGIHALMPWLLSFAAGAMLYVVAEELLPRAGGRRGTCGFLLGFLLMMILDVALG